MARIEDPNSVRQRAFKMLNNLTSIKREYAINILKQAFGIGDSYAATLYAAHRTIAKGKGKMTEVYVIRDLRDGKPCKPYVKVISTFQPKPDACLTIELAKAKYITELENKMAKVAQL